MTKKQAILACAIAPAAAHPDEVQHTQRIDVYLASSQDQSGLKVLAVHCGVEIINILANEIWEALSK